MGAGHAERVGDRLNREPPVESLQELNGEVGVFCAGEVKRLLQDLGFHGLAPEQAFEVVHAQLQLANPAGADDLLVGVQGLMMAALQHAPLPREQQAGRDAVATSDERHGRAGLLALLDEADLLGGGPAPSTLNDGQDLAVDRRGGRIE